MYLSQRLSRETGRDYALRTIKDNIVRLDLEPGSMVSENELATEMGLSRTPVREALIELSKVGIIEIYPQRGSSVALIDAELVEEARFMRLVLEKAIVVLDCEAVTPEDLQRLRKNVELYRFYAEHDDSDMMLKTDNEFHSILFQIAKKERIFSITKNMSIHFDRVRHMTLTTVKEQKVIQDHSDIVEAIAHNSPEKAVAVMEKHLTRYTVDEEAIRQRYPDYFKS